MPTSITIRNVPDEVRDELASRAALRGKSLRQYLLAELIELASQSRVAALMQRVQTRKDATRTRLSAEKIVAYLKEYRR